MVVKIKDLPKSERPCEKLINSGVNNLSNEELIAIILKTGNKELSAKELANKILSKVDNINKLNDLNYTELIKINGIGMMKACNLLAAIELGKRINEPIVNFKNEKLTNSKIVYDYFKDKLGNKKQEHFYCVYLDNSKKILDVKLLFIGTANYSIVHPREVFKEAYLLSAQALICVHNHPSNNLVPSREDYELTKRLIDVGNMLGIKVLDHIIIGQDNYYSFLENDDI